jgi:hypothetical protein
VHETVESPEEGAEDVVGEGEGEYDLEEISETEN